MCPGIDTNQVRATAMQMRLEAIQSQLAVSFTLCTLAETASRVGLADTVHALVEKVEHNAEVVGHHLDERNHVPGSSLADFQDGLARLKARIASVKTQSFGRAFFVRSEAHNAR